MDFGIHKVQDLSDVPDRQEAGLGHRSLSQLFSLFLITLRIREKVRKAWRYKCHFVIKCREGLSLHLLVVRPLIKPIEVTGTLPGFF
jgi:hypothetical protein